MILQCHFCKYDIFSMNKESLFSMYLLHMIRDHWTIMEMIHNTYKEGLDMRDLNEQLDKMTVR